MKLFKNKLLNIILCFYLFIWAAMPYKYWVILTILFFPLFYKSHYNKFNKNNSIYLLIVFLFYSVIYLYGFNNISISGNKPLIVLGILIQSIILFLVFSRTTKNIDSINLILAMSLGFLFHGLISSAYTYFIVGRQVGLGSLFSPFYGDFELGSALVSNYMTASTLVIIFLVKNRALKWSLVLISTIVSFYLIARSYFFICSLILVIYYIIYDKEKYSKIFIYFPLILLFGIIIYGILPADTVNLVLDTYAEKGARSLRWLHWEYALTNFADYPFGGLSVNHAIEDIDSFHNILIDSYRMAGFFGLTLLVALIIFPLFNMVKNESIFIYIGLLLILFQDVIFEGGQKLLIFTVIFLLLSNQIRINRGYNYNNTFNKN